MGFASNIKPWDVGNGFLKRGIYAAAKRQVLEVF